MMAVTGQISIIQVASGLIFHSGIFAGEKAQVTYQTDLLRVRVSIHKASHILGLVLRDETFSEVLKSIPNVHSHCAFYSSYFLWLHLLQTQSCSNLQCLHLCTCSVRCFTFKWLDDIISALYGSTAQLLLCRIWFQLTSPVQDDNSCVWDNLASFLHLVHLHMCQRLKWAELRVVWMWMKC